ncbi:hypothetical protein BHE74_00047528 [Ensete ventricosum]|nr:hypothetical protein BHE74_00047528 [Ensete ventricosum]
MIRRAFCVVSLPGRLDPGFPRPGLHPRSTPGWYSAANQRSTRGSRAADLPMNAQTTTRTGWVRNASLRLPPTDSSRARARGEFPLHADLSPWWAHHVMFRARAATSPASQPCKRVERRKRRRRCLRQSPASSRIVLAQKTTTKTKAKAKEGRHHGSFLVVTGGFEKKAGQARSVTNKRGKKRRRKACVDLHLPSN